MSVSGCIFKRFSGSLLFLLAIIIPAEGQTGVLDSLFSFSAGSVKTGSALNIISRRTGYYFTFDSKIINTEIKVNLDFKQAPLRTILDSVLNNDSLRFSVINRYIIIYKYSPPSVQQFPEPEWEVKTITGVITDNESGEPLPFAAIGIMSRGRGTVTNNNGIFNLKITRECIDDSLSVSYLGYYNRKIPVRQAIDNQFNIRMMREYISIPEIIIRNQIPVEIIRKAYNAIAKNYGNTPALMSAFYREAALKRSNLQIYSEAILQIYKSSYTGSLLGDQVRVVKSRKIENIGLRDTLTVRLKAGLNSTLQLDGTRNIFDFLLPENYDQYDYRMTDIVTVDDESAFVIEFIQKPAIDFPLYKGAIYINTANYAVLRAEFELNPEYIHKSRADFITDNARGYRMWPVTMKYTVSYRENNGRYFLNHVRGDLAFNARQKSRLFSTTFDVFFELAVTEIILEDVSRFDREELAPVHSVFSKTISSYDPVFWGNMDFLRPEENLLQALKNMNVRLQEFSK